MSSLLLLKSCSDRSMNGLHRKCHQTLPQAISSENSFIDFRMIYDAMILHLADDVIFAVSFKVEKGYFSEFTQHEKYLNHNPM